MLRKKYTRIPLLGPSPVFKDAGPLWVPYLSIRLGTAQRQTPAFSALIDTGSPYCLFSTKVSEFLKIKYESGAVEEVYGISGKVPERVFFHKVRL